VKARATDYVSLEASADKLANQPEDTTKLSLMAQSDASIEV